MPVVISIVAKIKKMTGELRQLLAQRPDWRASLTKGNHIKLLGPGGAVVIASSSPSDHREIKNTVARMRRVEGRS